MNNAKFLPLWPFVVVDVFFVGLAALLLKFGHHPLSWQEACLLVLCGVLGSWSFITPFLRRNADGQNLSQAQLLADAMAQLQKLDQLASQISGATNQWLELHSHTAKTAESAKEVAAGMSDEVKAFTEFLQKAGEAEKAQLRLEVEKLRRAEGERLQIIVHLLDRIFALFQAARHSGQPALAEQIGNFQKDCHEAVRRIGLLQLTVPAGENFDPKLHQLPETMSPAENASVADTLAAGYTYQGKLLRRPLVALQESKN
jgi:molecular chaperone GrpE (heat shock protein)